MPVPAVKVYVTLKPSLLDAQGRVVQNALNNLGYEGVEDVRIGKFIEMQVDGDEAAVKQKVTEMCDRLLANPVIEDYRCEVGS
jgi:phosphoribosylformylglycinamidine synthase